MSPQVFEVDRPNVQGLVASAYGHLEYAAYVMFQVTDRTLAKRWLAASSQQAALATGKSADARHMNIAFTYSGLTAMGLSQKDLSRFSRPFREGMVDDTGHRSRILGDRESLKNWSWGTKETYQPDLLVLMYANSSTALDRELEALVAPGNGLGILSKLYTCWLPDHKEHFGFVDGISQPTIKGFEARRQRNRTGQRRARIRCRGCRA